MPSQILELEKQIYRQLEAKAEPDSKELEIKSRISRYVTRTRQTRDKTDFPEMIKEFAEILELLSDYVSQKWSLLSLEERQPYLELIPLLLEKHLKPESESDKKYFEICERARCEYTNKVFAAIEKEKATELDDLDDLDPNSAEGKAIRRITASDELTPWITTIERGRA